MYIQSGAWDIISMNKDILKKNIISKLKVRLRVLKTMRVHIMLAIIAVGIVAITITAVTVRTYYLDRALSMRVASVGEYAGRLSTRMESNAYLNASTPNNDIDRELAVVAGLLDGRIIVVDSKLRIVSDTYGVEVGKTLISSEAVRGIRGISNQYVDRENRQVELVIPIAATLPKADSNVAEPAGARNGTSGTIIISFSIEDIYSLLRTLDQRIVFMSIVSFMLLVMFAVTFATRMTKPFKALTRSIHHVTEGYMEDKVDIHGHTEMEEISDSFNEMLRRIKQLEDSRQEFVSNVSHELKTPITSIKVLADSLLMQEDAPIELYREFMSDINDEIDRENKIITDLLALVKLDKKTGDMHVAEVSVNELLEIILKRIKPIAQRDNIELVFETYRPVIAEIDEVKMSLALSNLVENAVKYNRTSGWVRVSLNSDHKYFYVKVADSGIGIPEESQNLIFDRFYRVDKTRSRESGGTGLGLAITKNVILMHNGSIKVYSDEGEGTTFTVRVPLSFIP